MEQWQGFHFRHCVQEFEVYGQFRFYCSEILVMVVVKCFFCVCRGEGVVIGRVAEEKV